MSEEPYTYDTESHRKKVEAVAAFPDDSKIICDVQLYCTPVIRKDLDAGERNSLRDDPLCGPVDGHQLHQKRAVIVRLPEFEYNLPE